MIPIPFPVYQIALQTIHEMMVKEYGSEPTTCASFAMRVFMLDPHDCRKMFESALKNVGYPLSDIPLYTEWFVKGGWQLSYTDYQTYINVKNGGDSNNLEPIIRL